MAGKITLKLLSRTEHQHGTGKEWVETYGVSRKVASLLQTILDGEAQDTAYALCEVGLEQNIAVFTGQIEAGNEQDSYREMGECIIADMATVGIAHEDIIWQDPMHYGWGVE